LKVQVSKTENRVALDVSDRFAERSESGAKLRREKLGLLPGGEVPAVLDLVEINQVAIGAAGPPPPPPPRAIAEASVTTQSAQTATLVARIPIVFFFMARSSILFNCSLRRQFHFRCRSTLLFGNRCSATKGLLAYQSPPN
jgi:hypothetical protein